MAEEGDASKTESSIDNYGHNSYYYWHKHRSLATEDAAPPPEPVLLKKEKVEVEEQIRYKNIEKYSWMDDGPRVKIYIEMDGIADHPMENIICEFDVRSFKLKVHDFQDQNFQLSISDLHDDINMEESSVRTRKKNIIVSLKKLAEANWYDLKKK